MSLITEDGLDKLISLKQVGLALPDTWKEDVEKYYQLKKKGYEIERQRWESYKNQSFEIFKKIGIILQSI